MANGNNQAIYRWHQNGVLYLEQLPYAGGGKGLPSPLHPRPMGVCPLEPQNEAFAQQLSGAHGSGMLRQSFEVR